MKHILFLLLISLFIQPSLFGQLQEEKLNYIPNQLIIRMQKGENPGILESLAPEKFKLKIERVLSQHSDIWLLSFDDEAVEVDEVIKTVIRYNKVFLAQKNHILTKRETTPNDPLFGNQWQHNNIDSKLAWDITTGGTTPSGTDIVVALIESADLLNHPDLQDNHWKNTAEIPGNGIDDDGNGYVDDYNGWNVSSNNDNIGTGSHGTNCAGMIGAKGNNNLGVTGINWDVKIMNVAGHNSPFTESNIVECYNYALQARLRWNNTNGAEGAFVVATSTSWGTDNANPNNYPIWCGFYEDLGNAGILNAGATTNNSSNVDVVGDVPSACPSDYMVSVTATNQSDIIDFAGYGQNTINVGAPGSQIYTTSSNGGYTSTSGTSFATPLTAGLIGLLYSVPCPNLEIMALNDPKGTADIVRQALFDGVDQTAYLQTRTTTGGRINARNSIDLLMYEVCSSCPTATNISISDINNYNATIEFETNEDVENYTIYLQVAGSDNWISFNTTDSTYHFTDLTSCTDYEYYIVANCEEESSNPSMLGTFTTSGCGNCIDLDYCETNATNQGVGLRVFNPSSIAGSYSYVPTTSFGGSVANGYAFGQLVLVDDGSSAGDEGCGALINASEINGNIAVVKRGECNFTDKAMNAQNAGATAIIVINNVTSAPIEMGGTNNNVTIPAVMITLSDGNILLDAINNNENPIAILGKQNEWIESFEIDETLNVSGDNNGYLLSSLGTTLTQGESYSFSLTPGYDGQPLPEYTRIWIDLNQDGEFDSDELMYDQGEASTEIITGDLLIPMEALTGSTRMRVQMSFQPTDDYTLPGSCGTFDQGEIEDYCINIVTGQICNMNVTTEVTNPTCSNLGDGSINVDVTGEGDSFSFLWNNGETSNSVSNLGANNYSVIITDESGCDTTVYFSLSYERVLEIESTVVHPSCSNLNDGEIAINITGGEAYTYSWNNGATIPVSSNLGEGTYQVTVTDELGCTITESYTLTAPNVPVPDVNFTSSSDDFVAQFTNTSTNSDSYLWDFGDGNTSTDVNPVHTFDEVGNYNVCLTGYGTCDTITTCNSITITETSGLADEEMAIEYLRIFPNPAKDYVVIENHFPEAKKTIVYNTEGQIVYEIELKEMTEEIDVKKWPVGLYLFHILDKNNEKLFIQKVSVVK